MTLEAVQAAIAALKAEGMSPSVRTIRRYLGYGSHRDICRLLRVLSGPDPDADAVAAFIAQCCGFDAQGYTHRQDLYHTVAAWRTLYKRPDLRWAEVEEVLAHPEIGCVLVEGRWQGLILTPLPPALVAAHFVQHACEFTPAARSSLTDLWGTLATWNTRYRYCPNPEAVIPLLVQHGVEAGWDIATWRGVRFHVPAP